MVRNTEINNSNFYTLFNFVLNIFIPNISMLIGLVFFNLNPNQVIIFFIIQIVFLCLFNLLKVAFSKSFQKEILNSATINKNTFTLENQKDIRAIELKLKVYNIFSSILLNTMFCVPIIIGIKYIFLKDISWNSILFNQKINFIILFSIFIVDFLVRFLIKGDQYIVEQRILLSEPILKIIILFFALWSGLIFAGIDNAEFLLVFCLIFFKIIFEFLYFIFAELKQRTGKSYGCTLV